MTLVGDGVAADVADYPGSQTCYFGCLSALGADDGDGAVDAAGDGAAAVGDDDVGDAHGAADAAGGAADGAEADDIAGCGDDTEVATLRAPSTAAGVAVAVPAADPYPCLCS